MRESITSVRVRILASALLALFAGACGGLQQASAPQQPAEHTVVLISVDGFRRDYLERHAPPTLMALAAEGVVADAMIPSFPTLTFPNHYTIVTGLRPQNHGIVNNTMYDPVFDASFSLRNEGPREDRWWGGEPIWSTAEKQGVRAAAFFWPGTEVEIAGARPTRWMPYDGRVPYATRVDSVLAWLSLPEAERPRMVTLYFEEPDHTGHEEGPESAAVRGAVLKSDSALARLVNGLRQRGLFDIVNLVVVSDHGMTEVTPERHVYVSDVLDTAAFHVIAGGPVFMGWSRTGDNAGMVAALRRLPHVSAWLKEDVPERLHFNDHRRITPVVAMADDGWVISANRSWHPTGGGRHGYDNELPAMRTIFIARGPAFRRGARIPEFSNVDVYALLARVLGLRPAPNDGSLAIAGAALR
ncbi:MAG TPA: ectonucleotide pyrophosphatase/phosphodiesterase [Gemmatimonadaceae bacterium]|nr:ectonucleotide pyrophosphatase/phosphodiesterase [Gemmatimonadaceae bacterium]